LIYHFDERGHLNGHVHGDKLARNERPIVSQLRALSHTERVIENPLILNTLEFTQSGCWEMALTVR
jgi:hypothetical protein